MGKKYTTDEIEVGGHMLDASMMSGLNTIVSAGSHTLAGYLTTYTDTTYSVGNGGLTEINFTSALNTKLAGIATGANNYVLPFTNNSANWNTAYGWGNHASAGYVTSSGNTIIGTDADINTSGATIIDNLYMTDGVITSHGTRNLTLADLGYTGATNANYITNNNQLTNGASYLTTSGKAADSNLLDGIDSASFLRSDTTDYLTSTIYNRGYFISGENGYRDKGLFSVYDSYRTAPIWSMGTAYKNHADGTNFGNLYGLAYKHTNNPTGGTMGGGHQMVWAVNGTAKGSIGDDAVWHATSMKAPIFYDSNNTAYYLNPASTSRLAGSHFDYIGAGTGANTSGSYRLNMGGNIHMNNNTIDYAAQLHFQDNVRFYDDGNDSYLNFKYGDATTGGIKFLNGGGTVKGYVFANAESFGLLDATGNWAVKTAVGAAPLTLSSNSNPEFLVYDSYTYSPGSSRAPIFYDSNNTGYYLDPTSTSVLSNLILKTTSGSTRIEIESASNWSYCRYKNGASVRFDTGVYQNGNYEIRPYGASSNRTYFDYSGNSFSEASKRAPIFYDSNNTGFYLNPAGTSLMNSIVFTGNSTPIVSKYSGKKSWVQHITDNAYIFAPSTAIDGTSWDWPNQTKFAADGTVTAKNFILSSDGRLKTKIADLSCDNIDVNWKSFEMTSSEGEYRTGVIAQELEQKHPEFVNTDDEGFKSVKYIDLLIAKIAELEARLEKLEK